MNHDILIISQLYHDHDSWKYYHMDQQNGQRKGLNNDDNSKWFRDEDCTVELLQPTGIVEANPLDVLRWNIAISSKSFFGTTMAIDHVMSQFSSMIYLWIKEDDSL